MSRAPAETDCVGPSVGNSPHQTSSAAVIGAGLHLRWRRLRIPEEEGGLVVAAADDVYGR